MDYSASCPCESIQITLSLPQAIEYYQPRECDCDFCRLHNLAYVSDPLGTLNIKSSAPVNYLKQGSKQASFIQCVRCEQIVAVMFRGDMVQKGAVSAALFANHLALNERQITSPKLLNSADKRKRWHDLWLTVHVETGAIPSHR